jgi:capsular polysaccharide biosynthesis protein
VPKKEIRMEEQEIDLADYLSVIIKRKRLILFGTIICGVIAAAYSILRETPLQEYEARASLLVIPPPVKSDLHLSPFSISVYKELAKAQDLEQAIIDSLGLKNKNGEQLSLSSFSNALEANSTENGSGPSMDLVVTSADTLVLPPVKVANVWAALFVQENNGLNNREAQGSFETISRQYDIAQSNLQEAEDRLNAFTHRFELVILKTEVEARTAKLQEYQKAYVNNSLELKRQIQGLEDVESQLVAQETSDGMWVGSFEAVGMDISGRRALNEDQKKVLDAVIATRDEFRSLTDWMRDFQNENDLEVMGNSLEIKRALLISYTSDQSQLRIDVGVTDQILKDIGGTNGDTERRIRVSDSIPSRALREVLSLSTGYNLFSPRINHLDDEIAGLKSEIDLVEISYSKKKAEWDRKSEELKTIQGRYQALNTAYNGLRLAANRLKSSINALRPAVTRSEELERLKSESRRLSERIADLELEQSRLTRGIDTAKSTYGKFAGLLENAKVAKAGQPSDLKIVALSVEAVPVASEASRNVVVLALGVGLLVSVFLAFFLEYLEKANIRLREGGHAIG